MARLDEVKTREAKTTPGPWIADSTHVLTAINAGKKHIAMVNIWSGDFRPKNERINIDEHNANVAFIVHARADIPWLIAQLEASQAEAERLRAAVLELMPLVYDNDMAGESNFEIAVLKLAKLVDYKAQQAVGRE